MLNALVGKELAHKYDLEPSESKKNTAVYNSTQKLYKSFGNITGLKKEFAIVDYLHNLSKEKFKIIDKDKEVSTITKMEILDIYNSIKNKLIKERYYNYYGEKQVASLISKLSKEEKQNSRYNDEYGSKL